MKIKIPMHLLGSWLLSLTLFLAVSVPVLAQSEITDALLEAERFEQQALEPAGAITGQNSNRPMAFPDPYCEVSGFSTVEAITRVIFSDIDNTSAASSAVSHEDFTSVVGNVDAGETYTFTLEGYTGGNYSNYVIVWVDWDQDGVFNESTERYDIGVIANSTGEDGVQVSEDIEVPADAVVGETRMRVMKRFGSTSGSATSCAGATSWGQAEDYTVEVSGGGNAGETCDAPIVVASLPFDDAGNTADYGNNYSSGDVPPVATGAVTTGTGSTSYLNGDDVVYAYTPADDEVLNISTTNDDDWIGLWAFTGCPFTSTVGYHTATSGSTRSIEGLPVTAGETYYFVISTWPSPQSTDYTIHIESVGGDPDPSAYCIPEGTNANRYIDNFSTTGGTQDVSNMGSGFSPDGYGDFYDTHTVAQAHGEDVTFEVDIEGGTAGFRIWVDWNQDGVFDTTEEVAYASSGYSADHTGSFTVPADALEGDTRMRIVSHWLSSSGDIDPCETGFTYGEFEDYKFTVGTGGGMVYCIPEGTNANRYIDNFSTTGGTQDVSNMGSGFSPDGYGDFYDTHTVAQAHGEDVTFEVDIEGGTAGFRIWVDWNQDGVFDTTEEVAYASSGYSADHTGSFTVPADALEGDTRMRIVSHWLSSSGDIDPCETGFTYGEFEDYKFTVGSGGSVVYCIPEGTNSNRYIDNFSTTGGTQDVSNMGSGFSPDGYGDFYDTHTVAQAHGEDVTFEVDIEGGTAGFRIWVDWNQDGVFDTTEEVAYASSGYSSNHTGSFTVPADALEGDTRMRIVSHWLSSSGDIDPCETGFTYGEFEDYKFTVEAGTGGGTACEQDFAFSLDDGTGNLQTLLFADDFEIDSGTTMSVEKVTFRVFNNIGEATTLTIYEDDGGLPGNIVDTFSNVTPDSQTVIGSNFGFDAYDIVFTLPTVVELDSGIYWAAIQVTEGTDLATNYWVISNEGVHTPGQYSPDGGVTDRKS